jgi:hypothetical protein
VLRRIFGPKRDEVMGEWRKLHSGELHNLYSSPDIIRQIKSKRMWWAGHVACTGKVRKCTGFRWESPKERDHSEDRGVYGRIGLELILGRLAGVCVCVWCRFTWLRIGTGGRCSCTGDEPSGSGAMELVSSRTSTHFIFRDKLLVTAELICSMDFWGNFIDISLDEQVGFHFHSFTFVSFFAGGLKISITVT